jgi:UDP-N-acetylmuramoylalanine--D-glutamate ligase
MTPTLMPLAVPGFLQSRLDRPVAILGGGVSGRGLCALLGAVGAEVVVYDARERAFTAADADRHALFVFSPGFAPDHPWLRLARATGGTCLSEVDFASLCWRGRIVAVTGTNGKTTLTEFLTHALSSIGRDVVATGNIGHAFSQLVAERQGGEPEAIALCEVSSFQAETLRYFHAETTLWTNFAEDHLERHENLEGYFAAKGELVRRSDAVFAGSSVQAFARSHPLAAEAQDRFHWVPTELQPPDPRLAGTPFAEYPQRENFLLAATWWRASGFDEADLHAAAHSFVVGAHRLAPVEEIDGVTYWDDSKATNFHAVEAALTRFRAPVLLIAGGKAKGGNLTAFVQRIRSRVRQLFLIGETAPRLAAAADAVGLAHADCSSLGEAVRRAAEVARPGDHVLLSPGFSSFDMFRNYEDRGNQFAALVRARRSSPPAR